MVTNSPTDSTTKAQDLTLRGNLRNWWTPEDLKNFQECGDCVAEQFSEFEVEPGLHVNGKLVEGEGIADLSALYRYKQDIQSRRKPSIYITTNISWWVCRVSNDN